MARNGRRRLIRNYVIPRNGWLTNFQGDSHESSRAWLSFSEKIFTSDFPARDVLPEPRGLWERPDLIITAAYYAIPILLFVFLRKRKDFTLNWIVGAFAVFILACGTTHLLGVWTVWHATYRLDGLVKAITAAASVTTALLLAPMLPKLVQLPNPMQLIAMNRKLEKEAKQLAESAETMRRHADLLELAHDAIIVRNGRYDSLLEPGCGEAVWMAARRGLATHDAGTAPDAASRWSGLQPERSRALRTLGRRAAAQPARRGANHGPQPVGNAADR